MMVVSSAAEYNPFHNGHALHIERSKAQSGCEFFLAVMSGNIVQRGEPAIFDKHTRARAALLNGADLVIELPYVCACASAEYFARGAVSVIRRTGISDALSFGAETASPDGLIKLARFFNENDDKFIQILKNYLKNGMSYPSARKKAAGESNESLDISLLDGPNNILGVEYLKALYSSGYDTRVVTVKRDSDHHGVALGGSTPSAAAVRAALLSGGIEKISGAVPRDALRLYEKVMEDGNGPYLMDALSPILRYIIKTRGASYIKNIFEVSEGLENRIAASSAKFLHISDIITDIKTKRYTFTKINRILLHIILGITKDDAEAYEAAGGPLYIRVLGFKKSSEGLLRLLVKNSALPVVINLKNDMKKLPPAAAAALEAEIAASDIFYFANSGGNNKFSEKGLEYRMPVVVV